MANEVFLRGVVNGNDILVGAGKTDGSLGGGGIPVGTIVSTIVTNIPSGWLLCDGSTKNTADYPALASALGATGSTFTLPDFRGRVIQGATSNQSPGTALSAGLPDITGMIGQAYYGYGDWICSGAFYQAGRSGDATRGGGGGDPDNVSIGFAARLSNSIYGSSNTVQPPAIVVNVIIKY